MTKHLVIKGSKSSVIDISNVMKTIGSGPKVNGEKIESIKLNFRCNGRDENLKKNLLWLLLSPEFTLACHCRFVYVKLKTNWHFLFCRNTLKNKNNSNKYLKKNLSQLIILFTAFYFYSIHNFINLWTFKFINLQRWCLCKSVVEHIFTSPAIIGRAAVAWYRVVVEMFLVK